MVGVYPVLSQYMKDHGITSKELATVANISRLTFYMKMWGIKRWTLTEAVSICCFFNTHEVEHLFHQEKVFSFV